MGFKVTNRDQRSVRCEFVGVRLKHVAPGDEPTVALDVDASDDRSIEVVLYLMHGRGHGDFEEFRLDGAIPRRFFLSQCEIDMKSFEQDLEAKCAEAMTLALDRALNLAGTLLFSGNHGEVRAVFGFDTFRLVYQFTEEEVERFFIVDDTVEDPSS